MNWKQSLTQGQQISQITNKHNTIKVVGHLDTHLKLVAWVALSYGRASVSICHAFRFWHTQRLHRFNIRLFINWPGRVMGQSGVVSRNVCLHTHMHSRSNSYFRNPHKFLHSSMARSSKSPQHLERGKEVLVFDFYLQALHLQGKIKFDQNFQKKKNSHFA